MARLARSVKTTVWRGDDDALSSVRLSIFGLRREPPRPPDDRKRGYEELFDYDTLYYDVFRSGDGRHVICQGPPLLRCEEALSRLTFHLPGAKRPLSAHYRAPRTNLQPTHRVYLFGENLPEAQTIVLQLAETSIEVPIQPSGRARFAGRRVVTTLSKNNPLDWIGDWAEFNVRVHGADAIILYDNGSTDLHARRHRRAYRQARRPGRAADHSVEFSLRARRRSTQCAGFLLLPAWPARSRAASLLRRGARGPQYRYRRTGRRSAEASPSLSASNEANVRRSSFPAPGWRRSIRARRLVD